jgi:Fe-S-cluster-containing dehydrogenase component
MKDYVKEYQPSDLPHLKSLSHISPNALNDERFKKLHDDVSLRQWCEGAPCLPVCPAEYDIRGLLRRIEAGNHNGAYDILRKNNKAKTNVAINCLDCPSPCYEACKGKNGNVHAVNIKKIMVELASLLH